MTDIFRETSSTSGYSSVRTSPQFSDENLLLPSGRSKVRLQIKSRDVSHLYISSNYGSEEGFSEDESFEEGPDMTKEESCEFKPVEVPNEMDPYKKWYHRLITFKIEFERGERGAVPPFPPPPMPSVMIAASKATSINPFEEVKRAAANETTKSPHTASFDKSMHRFCPADFRPLPPPHVFLGMIKTLAPHQYVDLTYALAGAALIELGLKVPDRFPPLPPKVEPFQDVKSEETTHLETEVSSQSSSEGEYSDASENTRFNQSLKRKENCERREARRIRIAAKMLLTNDVSRKRKNRRNNVQDVSETFPRDTNYKCKTLASFIPPKRFHQIPFTSIAPALKPKTLNVSKDMLLPLPHPMFHLPPFPMLPPFFFIPVSFPSPPSRQFSYNNGPQNR